MVGLLVPSLRAFHCLPRILTPTSHCAYMHTELLLADERLSCMKPTSSWCRETVHTSLSWFCFSLFSGLAPLIQPHLLWVIFVWAHSLMSGIVSLLLYFSQIISTCTPFWLLLMLQQTVLFKNRADETREREKALSQCQFSVLSKSSLHMSCELLHLFLELERTRQFKVTVCSLGIVAW